MTEASTASRAYRAARDHLIRRIEFTDDLPKTISGKIRRVELRTRQTVAESLPAEFRER